MRITVTISITIAIFIFSLHFLRLQTNPNLVGPFWAREFAVAHADIDDYSGQ